MSTKFSYQTYKRSNGKFGCAIAKMRVKHYGAHTAYGERSVLKPEKWWDVFGEFATRMDAVAAAKAAIETKKGTQ